jgi:hypothetical protein
VTALRARPDGLQRDTIVALAGSGVLSMRLRQKDEATLKIEETQDPLER